MTTEQLNERYARLSAAGRAAVESWPGAEMILREHRLDVMFRCGETTITLMVQDDPRAGWEVVHLVRVSESDVFTVRMKDLQDPFPLTHQMIAATRAWVRGRGRQPGPQPLAPGRTTGAAGTVHFNPPTQSWARYAGMQQLYLQLSRQLAS